MPRLIATFLLIVAVAVLIAAALGALREAWAIHGGRFGLREGETTMQRTAFLLLVALIFYAAIWGG